jgi:hypothetical protein
MNKLNMVHSFMAAMPNSTAFEFQANRVEFEEGFTRFYIEEADGTMRLMAHVPNDYYIQRLSSL